MIVMLDYASPSMFDSSGSDNALNITTDSRRPVCFHGTVKEHAFLLRVALRALGEVIWSDDTWLSQLDVLDPVITVHPDRIFFEAFSQDQSAYACLIVDPGLFELEQPLATGTTNIDFTAWLWSAIGEMRSSRRTTFRIGPGGFEIKNENAGGRFEKKVTIPDSWVRGFLQVQGAMALPGTRLDVKPIDLLSALRFLRYTKAKTSPRAIRYEFTPNQDARLILEPWEHSINLEGCHHNYTEPKTIRVWGRRRLRLLEPLLPFADSVEVYLKGRALPSFYAVRLPGMTFVLGLTGWSGQRFSGTASFDLLSNTTEVDDSLLSEVLSILRERYVVSVEELAEDLERDPQLIDHALARLCRQGRCMFDVETRCYRHRELFAQPADERKYFPPDLRKDLAQQFLDRNLVSISSCLPEEKTKSTRLKTPDGPVQRQIIHRDWRVLGLVDDVNNVEVVVGDTGRIIFGRCECFFFQEHLMNQGPCEHIIALFRASEDRRIDSATSQPVAPNHQPIEPTHRWQVDSEGTNEDK